VGMRKALLLAVVALAGCATAYKPNSFWNDGGFTETEVQPGLFQVKFKGNEFTTQDRTADLAMLRAADLCLSRGKSHMFLGDVATKSVQSGVAPGYSSTSGTATVTSYGNTAYVTGNAYTTTIPPASFYRPQSGLTVACTESKDGGAWDAAFLSQAMRSKYKITPK
jgi:hypothetical protein